MKIIFDSEEQKEKVMRRLTNTHCPKSLGLDSIGCSDDCYEEFEIECADCWAKSGLEIEVKEKE